MLICFGMQRMFPIGKKHCAHELRKTLEKLNVLHYTIESLLEKIQKGPIV